METLTIVRDAAPTPAYATKNQARPTNDSANNPKAGKTEHQRCCHYCAHSKAEHITQHLCTSCKRMYCDNCLKLNLAQDTSEFVLNTKPFVCPKCSGSCCCLKSQCYEKHTHCRPYARSPRGHHSTGSNVKLSRKAETARADRDIDCNELVLRQDSGAGAALRSIRSRRKRNYRSISSEDDDSDIVAPPTKRRKINLEAKPSIEDKGDEEEHSLTVSAYRSKERSSSFKTQKLTTREAAEALVSLFERGPKPPVTTTLPSSHAAGEADSTLPGLVRQDPLPLQARPKCRELPGALLFEDPNIHSEKLSTEQEKVLELVWLEIKQHLNSLRREMREHQEAVLKAKQTLHSMLESVRVERQQGAFEAGFKSSGSTSSPEMGSRRSGPSMCASFERLPPIVALDFNAVAV